MISSCMSLENSCQGSSDRTPPVFPNDWMNECIKISKDMFPTQDTLYKRSLGKTDKKVANLLRPATSILPIASQDSLQTWTFTGGEASENPSRSTTFPQNAVKQSLNFKASLKPFSRSSNTAAHLTVRVM